MKKINKIFLFIFIVICVFFIVANILVSVFAKKIVVQQIQQNLKMNATLESISVSFPLSVNLNNLEIGELFKVQRLSVSPNIFGFLAGKIVLNKLTLINPVINLIQLKSGELNLPKLEQKGKPPEIYLASLSVRKGKFIFTDKKVSPSGHKVILGGIDADIAKVAFPLTSLKTNFKLSANVLNSEDKKIGGLTFSGWLDYVPKDMDGLLGIEDLDLTYFSPYYGSFISSKKLQSAKLNIKASFKSVSNNLSILTNFRLSDLTYVKGESADTVVPQIDLTKNALDFFTDTKGNLDLDFNINTKLDNPNLSIAELEKIILKAAAKNLSHQSPEELIRKVNDNIEDIQSLGKSLEGLFKGKK